MARRCSVDVGTFSACQIDSCSWYGPHRNCTHVGSLKSRRQPTFGGSQEAYEQTKRKKPEYSERPHRTIEMGKLVTPLPVPPKFTRPARAAEPYAGRGTGGGAGRRAVLRCAEGDPGGAAPAGASALSAYGRRVSRRQACVSLPEFRQHECSFWPK